MIRSSAVRCGQRVLADLILRPWDTTRPAVTAQLTVTAPLAALSPARRGGEDARTTRPPGLRDHADQLALPAPPPPPTPPAEPPPS